MRGFRKPKPGMPLRPHALSGLRGAPLGINNADSRQKGGRCAAEPWRSRLGRRTSLPSFCRRSAATLPSFRRYDPTKPPWQPDTHPLQKRLLHPPPPSSSAVA